MKISRDVELELDHLERRRVPMSEQIADQTAVLVHLLGAVAVADPGRLDDAVGGLPLGHQPRHRVDRGDEPVVVDGDLPTKVPMHDVVQR